jgi:hypothetical protein
MPRAVAVGLPVPALQISARPRGYQSHFSHAGERIWPETNCCLGLYIESLHALGLDPVPAFGCALSPTTLGNVASVDSIGTAAITASS